MPAECASLTESCELHEASLTNTAHGQVLADHMVDSQSSS